MEPEVHIIEKYFQLIKQCFTITNIRLKGGKEIDLLAINPQSGEKYHVEARVSTTSAFKLRIRDTKLSDGRLHRRGLDFFDKQKFNHPTILEKIHELFQSMEYRKILVVWHVQENSVVKQGKKLYGIEVWLLRDILKELIDFAKKRPKGSRDDIMRMIEILALTEE